MSLGPNVIVETIPTSTGMSARESSFNAPAIETVNARLEQVGVFRDDSVGANQSFTAMQFQAIDAAAPIDVVAGRAGEIWGIVARAFDTGTTGAITAGTMTFQATIGGTQVGDVATLTPSVLKIETFLSTPVAFAAGDQLGIKNASTSLAPTTSRAHAWLLIRWTALST